MALFQLHKLYNVVILEPDASRWAAQAEESDAHPAEKTTSEINTPIVQ
jgi:hypothetical protein